MTSPGGGAARREHPVFLFQEFAQLGERLPHTSLGTFPTPVERLTHLGHASLWIKREDRSSPLYGGNKVRKLEFTLAEAIRAGRSKVVTMGGLGTNHGLATAIFAKQLGLATRLLLYRQPVTPFVKQQLLLFHHFGAELRCYRTALGAGAALYTTQRAANPGAYLLCAGGSSPMGTVGVVNAMFELRAQIRAGLMPEPDYIFCPLGTNGTMAGLSLGGILAGLKSKVIGVRVTRDRAGPVQLANEGTVKRLMQQTLALLRQNSPDVPPVEVPEPRIIHSYVGAGYGYPTRAGNEAAARAWEAEGLYLDDTYTAKTFAAAQDFINEPGHSRDTVLYWHTYNSVDHSALSASIDYHELPRTLHRLFEVRIETPGVHRPAG